MLRSFTPFGFLTLAGMMPSGYTAPVSGSLGQLLDARFEKSPWRFCWVGTVQVVVDPVRSRLKSCATKKKNFSRFLFSPKGRSNGPPRFQPKLFQRNTGLTIALNARASRASLRKYSYSLPWKLLVPLLSERLTTAPELVPASAL